MSVNQLHYNLPRKAPSKPPLSVSNVTQNIDRHNNPRSLAPAQKRMSKNSGNGSFYQPPDKRRKTEDSRVENSDDWGDDEFTEDQLENIDEMVLLSQQAPQERAVDGNHNKTVSSAPLSSRALGKGINRSQSTSDVHARAHGLPPVHPASKPSNQGGAQQRKPTATGEIFVLCTTTVWFQLICDL